MLSELEQRDVPAPRPTCDHGALGVGDPAGDEIREAGVHVLDLRAADVGDQDVSPLAPVPDGAAVVDHPDREARVDVRLHLRLPAVEVEPGRAAVDEHHHRERPARVVRGHVEAVHALAVRVLEVPRLVRPAFRGPRRRRQELGARVVEREPLPVSLLLDEPHAPVGSHARLPDEAGVARDLLERARRELVAEEPGPALVEVHEQERGGVGPPVVDVHLPLEVDVEVGPLPGRQVPDAGPRLTRALVPESEPLVARDR